MLRDCFEGDGGDFNFGWKYGTILLILIISFCVIAVIEGKKYNREIIIPTTEDTISVVGNSLTIDKDGKIFKYEYEGHLYQVHYIGDGTSPISAHIHDPECECFKNK